MVLLFAINSVIITPTVFSESTHKQGFFEAVAEHETNGMQRGILQWRDEFLVKKFQQFEFNDETILGLYQEFNDVLVEPPHPDQDPYRLDIDSDVVEKIVGLGKRLHNMILAMPDDAYAKWGNILMGMREILYLDSIHVPLAMRGDPSRNVYWYELHNAWVQKLRALVAELWTPDAIKFNQK